MKKIEIKEKFPLNREQMEKLHFQYYHSSKTNKEIIEEFQLHGLQPAQITMLFDDIKTDEFCDYCHIELMQPPPTRTSDKKVKYCPRCGHKIYPYSYQKCDCDSCKKSRRIISNRIIEDNRRAHKYSLEELTIEDRIIIGAIYCYATDDENQFHWNCMWDDLHLLKEPDEVHYLIQDYINSRILVFSENNEEGVFYYENGVERWDKYRGILLEFWVEKDSIEKINKGDIFEESDELEYSWQRVKKEGIIEYFYNIYAKYRIPNLSIKWLEKIYDKYLVEYSICKILTIIKYITGKKAHSLYSMSYRERDIAGLEILSHLEKYCIWITSNECHLTLGALDEFPIGLEVRYFYYNILKMEE